MTARQKASITSSLRGESKCTCSHKDTCVSIRQFYVHKYTLTYLFCEVSFSEWSTRTLFNLAWWLVFMWVIKHLKRLRYVQVWDFWTQTQQETTACYVKMKQQWSFLNKNKCRVDPWANKHVECFLSETLANCFQTTVNWGLYNGAHCCWCCRVMKR